MSYSKRATYIKSQVSKSNASQELYKLDPPLEGNEYVLVSAVIAYSGPETYIFGADPDGQVIDWLELPGSYRGGLNHKTALENADYIVEKEI